MRACNAEVRHHQTPYFLVLKKLEKWIPVLLIKLQNQKHRSNWDGCPGADVWLERGLEEKNWFDLLWSSFPSQSQPAHTNVWVKTHAPISGGNATTYLYSRCARAGSRRNPWSVSFHMWGVGEQWRRVCVCVFVSWLIPTKPLQETKKFQTKFPFSNSPTFYIFCLVDGIHLMKFTHLIRLSKIPNS